MKSNYLGWSIFVASILFFQTAGIGADIPKDPKEALDLARSERQLGVSKLNRARSGGANAGKLSREAMKHLEKAQDAYAYVLDEEGDDEKIEEEMADVQSLIY